MSAIGLRARICWICAALTIDALRELLAFAEARWPFAAGRDTEVSR